MTIHATRPATFLPTPDDAPELLPDVPGMASGIVGTDPLILQCHDCAATHEGTARTDAASVILSGFHFHRCEGATGVRRCPSCLAAVKRACPKRACKH